eukprot:SAG31_NODE_1326_length_8761_cov_3.896791_4_plen_52_part_00
MDMYSYLNLGIFKVYYKFSTRTNYKFIITCIDSTSSYEYRYSLPGCHLSSY